MSGNRTNMTPGKPNLIRTEAIIEQRTPVGSHKRPYVNGSFTGGSSQKKSCLVVSDSPIVIDNTTPKKKSLTTPTENLNNAIIIEPLGSISKVSLFDDQFKQKLNVLASTYSKLIDETGVKIKQEGGVKSKAKALKTPIDSGHVSNDSSDESDIIVLGPAPPKQYVEITLNENGDTIQEKLAADSGQPIEKVKSEKTNEISQLETQPWVNISSKQQHQPQPNTGSTSQQVSSDTYQQSNIGSSQPNTSCTTQSSSSGTSQPSSSGTSQPSSSGISLPSSSSKSKAIESLEEEEEDGEKSLCANPKKWTQEMINFYSEDINPVQFRQRIMTRINRTRPDDWWIDYHHSYRFADSQFNYNKICDNCDSRQHDIKNCPRPCFSVCPMCGETGHVPDKCPQSCCLNCGQKTHEYLFNCDECDQKVVLKIKCDVCANLYHTSDQCPHIWRSMEFTTRKGKLKVLPPDVEPTNMKFCSNCAVRGHLIEECPHLSAEHPLRQDRSWKVHAKAVTSYVSQYKLKVTGELSQVLLSKPGMEILQMLSTQLGVHIEYIVDDKGNVLTYQANPVQSHAIRSQLKKFLFNS